MLWIEQHERSLARGISICLPADYLCCSFFLFHRHHLLREARYFEQTSLDVATPNTLYWFSFRTNARFLSQLPAKIYRESERRWRNIAREELLSRRLNTFVFSSILCPLISNSNSLLRSCKDVSERSSEIIDTIESSRRLSTTKTFRQCSFARSHESWQRSSQPSGLFNSILFISFDLSLVNRFLSSELDKFNAISNDIEWNQASIILYWYVLSLLRSLNLPWSFFCLAIQF